MALHILGILFPVFACVVLGYIIGRCLKPDMQTVNKINFDAFLPCLVFASLSTMPLNTAKIPLIVAVIIAIIVPGVLMWLACKPLSVSYKEWVPPQMFRNSGNLAIPLFGFTFGDSALEAAVLIFVISSAIHIITAPLVLHGNFKASLKELAKMPVMIAAVAALTINLTGFPLWQPIHEAAKLMGNASVPIMLVSLGVQLTSTNRKSIPVGLSASFISLITGALAFIIIYLAVPLTTRELQMMVIYCMLPPAVMNYLYAEKYSVAPFNVAAMVLVGNFISIFTLPLLLLFAFSLG